MKPAWDKLMDKFAGHKDTLVGDVDCTAAGKPLCDANGVRGYPTIKSGDPSNLEDYKGGRDFDALVAHANSLKPSCSLANIDLCSGDEKKTIDAVMAKSDAEIAKVIADGDAKSAQAEADFNKAVEELQATYKALMKKKEDTQEEIKKSGLGLHKAAQAHKKKLAEIAAGSPDAKNEL